MYLVAIIDTIIYLYRPQQLIRFRKKSFPENLEFETMNMQKQPEKKQFPTASSLVVFHTNDFSDLIDKSTSQE